MGSSGMTPLVVRRMVPLLLSVACAGFAGVACGGAAPTGAGATPSGVPVASPTPVTSVPIVITEAGNGKTVVVARGQTVRLVLHSTYWTIGASSDFSVLQPGSGQTASPSPGCVPGAGCGTVAATFRAVGDGHVHLVASRITCGEALACNPSNGSFSVLVIVQG